jgi:hypothetical protein
MSDRFSHVAQRRAIIDRRGLWEAIEELGAGDSNVASKRAALAVLLRPALGARRRRRRHF